jgi:hypothetical protein
MKNLFLLVATIIVVGCQSYDISFYDDNESMLAVNMWASVDRINCENASTSRPQFFIVKENLTTFQLYTIAKGSSDITEILDLVQQTVDPTLMKDEISTAYCKAKKRSLETQSRDIAQSVMRRF